MADETPAPLSDTEVEAIRERAEAATPGPWTIEPHSLKVHARNEWVIPNVVAEISGGPRFFPEQAQRNADLIAAARTDIPRLLATVAAYREIVAAVANTLEDRGYHNHSLITRARALLATPPPTQPF